MTNKEIVIKVNDAFRNGDMEAFYELCAEDVCWTMMGKFKVEGKDALRKAMDGNGEWNNPELTGDAIIAEGDRASCTGIMRMVKKDGSDRFDGAYCDVYTFRDGKVTELTAYMVNIPAEGA